DLVVGTLRTFDIHPWDLRPAAFVCAALGQNLFAPPNVKGWPGGEAWIDSATLLGRKQFVDRLFRGNDMAAYAFDSARFESGAMRDAERSRLDALVLAVAPVNPVDGEMPPADRVRALVADAAYQLR